MFVASEFVAGLCLAGLAGGLGLGQRKGDEGALLGIGAGLLAQVS